jgi:hypothetical protein
MRLHYGPVPETADFHPSEDGWHSILEPGPVLIQFLALPVAFLCVGVLVTVMVAARPGLPLFMNLNWTILVLMLLLFPVHELLHVVGFPRLGFTPESVIGVWPSRLLFYAFHSGPLAKNTYLWVFAIPFLVISVLPVAIVALVRPLPFSQPAMSNLAFIAVVNAAASAGDVIGFFLVLLQVPRGAKVRNQGWRTFWKDEKKGLVTGDQG